MQLDGLVKLVELGLHQRLQLLLALGQRFAVVERAAQGIELLRQLGDSDFVDAQITGLPREQEPPLPAFGLDQGSGHLLQPLNGLLGVAQPCHGALAFGGRPVSGDADQDRGQRCQQKAEQHSARDVHIGVRVVAIVRRRGLER